MENEQGLLLGFCIPAKNKVYRKPVKNYLNLLNFTRDLAGSLSREERDFCEKALPLPDLEQILAPPALPLRGE